MKRNNISSRKCENLLVIPPDLTKKYLPGSSKRQKTIKIANITNILALLF